MLNLEKNEYAAFYQPYIQIIMDNDKNIIENLEYSFEYFNDIVSGIDAKKQLFRYEKNKWTIREIVQHLIDVERVFNYRAMRFSRNDVSDLPGFDENQFVLQSNANQRDFETLIAEFSSLRKATILMYHGFTNDILQLGGKANGSFISVRVLGYITSGHLLHHLSVIKDRYLI